MPGGIHPPLEVILKFPHPNYVNPERHSWAIPAMSIALFGVALIVVAIRLYVRLRITRSTGADDALIALAMIPNAAFTVALVGGMDGPFPALRARCLL